MPSGRGVMHVVETPVYDIGVSWLDGRAPDTLMRSDRDKYPSSIASDGQTIAYTRVDNGDYIMLRTGSGGLGTPLDTRDRSQNTASLSPDGAGIAWSELDPELR